MRARVRRACPRCGAWPAVVPPTSLPHYAPGWRGCGVRCPGCGLMVVDRSVREAQHRWDGMPEGYQGDVR